MYIIQKFIEKFSNYNFTIHDKKSLYIIYFILFVIILLENGIIFAAFLPGDTLLILTGTLISKGIIPFVFTTILLTIAASIGCWIGFAQGRYLKKTNFIKKYIKKIPEKHYIKANKLLKKNGLYALLIGRFLMFVRTLLPIIAGISTINQKLFHIFNWISSAIWIIVIITFAYFMNKIQFIKNHENTIINTLFVLPIILIIFGFISYILKINKNKKK